jgi:hypothetical protein
MGRVVSLLWHLLEIEKARVNEETRASEAELI